MQLWSEKADEVKHGEGNVGAGRIRKYTLRLRTQLAGLVLLVAGSRDDALHQGVGRRRETCGQGRASCRCAWWEFKPGGRWIAEGRGNKNNPG